jgi:hypothetical protein
MLTTEVKNKTRKKDYLQYYVQKIILLKRY